MVAGIDIGILLLAILAVWRISSSLAEEDGPGDPGLFIRYRIWLARGRPNWVRRGVACTWCTSFWVGATVGLYLCLVGLAGWWLFPLLWLGLSGGAIVVHTTLQGLLK